MPAFNFSKQFVNLVESGRKRQTIRAMRKRGNAKIGQTAYLYTGLRTSKCRKIGEGEIIRVRKIKIRRQLFQQATLMNEEGTRYEANFAGIYEMYGLQNVAIKDGFDSWADMTDWFLPGDKQEFEGYLIEWGPLKGL